MSMKIPEKRQRDKAQEQPAFVPVFPQPVGINWPLFEVGFLCYIATRPYVLNTSIMSGEVAYTHLNTHSTYQVKSLG